MQIDGRAVAAKIRDGLKEEVAQLKAEYGVTPGLATVLVGDDGGSRTYVRMKRRACANVGMDSFAHELAGDTSQEELEALVKKLNDDPKVHGILVQMPLPDHLDEQAVLDLLSYKKDVDGLHPTNVGMLAIKGREPLFKPCTPHGIMVLLEEAGIDPEGKKAVVIGRSNLVGIPVSLLLLDANATVTVAHSRTQDLPAVCREADILVAAVGRPEMVKADWVKDGAVVIDVGTNRIDDESDERGYYLTGDVATEEVEPIASAITPSPGGVGPMTIAMLLTNTVRSARYTVTS